MKTTRLLLATVALVAALVVALFTGTVHGFVAGAVLYVAADLAVLPLVKHLVPTGALYANSLGTLSTGLILVEALSQAIKIRPALSMVTMDFSAVPALRNDVVRSRVIGSATVNNHGTGATDRTDTDVSVTLDGFKEIHHKFTAAEINATRRDLVAESARPIAEALADHWMDQLAALWASLTFTNSTTIASASFEYSTLTDIREALNADSRAVPKKGRFGVVNSSVFKYLLQDPLCNRTQKTEGNDPIADGELGRIAGFENIFEHPGLPSTNNTNGFFGHKETTILMVRPAANLQAMYPSIPADGNMGIISIPDPNDPNKPGLSVLAIEKIDSINLTVETKVAWLQGSAVGREAFGQRTKTA